MSFTKNINVGDNFRMQDGGTSMAVQPADYTPYSQGAKKIGVICQDGLMKRKADAESYRTALLLSPITKGGSSPVAVGNAKVFPNRGILAGLDKFFNWVNRVIGV